MVQARSNSGGLGPVTVTAKTATFPGSPDTVSGSVDFEVATQLALDDSLVVPLIAEGESYDYAILGGASDSVQVTTFAGSAGDVDLYIFAPGVLNPVVNNNGGGSASTSAERGTTAAMRTATASSARLGSTEFVSSPLTDLVTSMA